MGLTLLERGLLVAARAPGGAAMARAGTLYVATDPVERVVEHDPRRALARFADAVDAWRDARAGAAPRAFGWLAYDALRADEPRGFDDPRPRGDRAPAAYLARYDEVFAIDLATGASAVVASRDAGAAARLRAAWDASAGWALPPRRALATRSATDEGAHRRAVESIREAIRDGEVYLVNLARVVHAPALARDEVAARVAAARAPYAALIDGPSALLGGMSMELGLRFDRGAGAAASHPIKGTRPRGAGPDDDARLARELAADPKERAENVMALDVHRNDLGRVAVAGSVEVTALCEVEPHAFVHHLVSRVRARVEPGTRTAALLEAVLPLGSVTGAPKRSAMARIAREEPERRGVYTGVYGMAAGDGSLELAVAIRTLVVDGAGTHYGAGGGIVIESDPAREWQELAWKERALFG